MVERRVTVSWWEPVTSRGSRGRGSWWLWLVGLVLLPAVLGGPAVGVWYMARWAVSQRVIKDALTAKTKAETVLSKYSKTDFDSTLKWIESELAEVASSRDNRVEALQNMRRKFAAVDADRIHWQVPIEGTTEHHVGLQRITLLEGSKMQRVCVTTVVRGAEGEAAAEWIHRRNTGRDYTARRLIPDRGTASIGPGRDEAGARLLEKGGRLEVRGAVYLGDDELTSEVDVLIVPDEVDVLIVPEEKDAGIEE